MRWVAPAHKRSPEGDVSIGPTTCLEDSTFRSFLGQRDNDTDMGDTIFMEVSGIAVIADLIIVGGSQAYVDVDTSNVILCHKRC